MSSKSLTEVDNLVQCRDSRVIQRIELSCIVLPHKENYRTKSDTP